MSERTITVEVVWDDDSIKEMDIDLQAISAITSADNHQRSIIYGKGIDGWTINQPYFKFKTLWSRALVAIMAKVFVLLISFFQLSAQPVFTIGIDPRNALFGSDYNPPALNAKFKFGYMLEDQVKCPGSLFGRVEIGGEFEVFPYLNYIHAAVYSQYSMIRTNRINAAIGISSGAIAEKGYQYATVAPIGELRVNVWKGFSIGWISEYRYRGEWSIWKYSNYVTLSLKKRLIE